MVADIGKYIDYFLENDTSILKELIEQDNFNYEITDYLVNEKGICPRCFEVLNEIREKTLVTNDPMPIYENLFIGVKCNSCGYSGKEW